MTTISNTPSTTSSTSSTVDPTRLASRSARGARVVVGRITWSGVERGGTFLLPLAAYLWVGASLALAVGGLPGDALARSASASATVLGRDPHLESIGFVWGPFPTLWQVPLVWLSGGWRPMVADGLAAVVVSAVLMAGMLTVVRRWLEECGVGAVARLGLVAVLALNPFVLLYAANGMSEAGLLFFGAVAARRLARWWEDDRPADLVVCGVALAFAYLTRYEALASILTVIVAVAFHTWRSVRPAAQQAARALGRGRAALLAAASVGAPPVFAVLAWAAASWAIVGEPFAQLTSQYGNSAMVQASATGIAQVVGDDSTFARVWFFVRQLGAFGGIALVAVALVMWFGTRAGARVGGALLVLAPCVVFNLLAAATGSTYVWGRYVLVAVPLGVMLLGPFVRSVAADSGVRAARSVAPVVAVALTALAAVVSFQVVEVGALQTAEERSQLAALPGLSANWPATTVQEEGGRIAAEIDRLGAGEGEILTDAAVTFPVVMASADQRQFVVPSDREFARILADPGPGGVRYLLVTDGTGAQFDAVADALPELGAADGGTTARRIAEWGDDGSFLHLRLYELSAGVRR